MSLSASIASQWLALRLQLLGLVVIVSIAILAVINAAYEIIPMSGSKLGLALSYAFALVGYVNGLVDSVSRAEQELISVERVGEYVALPDEFDQHQRNYKYKNRNSKNSNSTTEVSSVVSHIKNLFRKGEDVSSSAEWPQNGTIELFDVSFSYGVEHQEYERLTAWYAAKAGSNNERIDRNSGIEKMEQQSFALSNISLNFPGGSRTVVIGRTGI